MSEKIVDMCLEKGVKLTDQRKIIARVLGESKENYGEADHPDVDELYSRVSKIDSKISIATVYRTVKLFEESGIVEKHDFKGGKARYELLKLNKFIFFDIFIPFATASETLIEEKPSSIVKRIFL